MTRPFLPPLEEFSQGLREIWETRWLTNNGPKHQALEAARTFKPLSAAAVAALLARTATAAATGQYEGFKTTAAFDGTAHHPEWLG